MIRREMGAALGPGGAAGGAPVGELAGPDLLRDVAGEADAHLAERVLRYSDSVLVLENGHRLGGDVAHVIS